MKAIIGNKKYDCMVIERVKVRRKGRGDMKQDTKEWIKDGGAVLVLVVTFIAIYIMMAAW